MLSPHRGEETHTADARTESPFETPAGAQECIPSGVGVRVLGSRRSGVSRVDRKNHADGAATMGQDVRRPRLPHVAHDARRMGFQFPNADGLPRRSGPVGLFDVVPHVTTLWWGALRVKVTLRSHDDAGAEIEQVRRQ